MSNRFANPKTMPAPRGYTQVVETTGPGRTVYLSGQLGMTTGGAFAGAPGDFRAQATQCFENLKAGTSLRPKGKLIQALDTTWKDLEVWNEDFAHTGQIRGVGWAILYHDPGTGHLFNWWVGDHELGHPAGFTPILVMDVWEHAYMVDHGAGGRKDYIEAFMENVNWDAVEQRFEESRARKN